MVVVEWLARTPNSRETLGLIPATAKLCQCEPAAHQEKNDNLSFAARSNNGL